MADTRQDRLIAAGEILLASAARSRGTWAVREQDYGLNVGACCSTCKEGRINLVWGTTLRCHCDEQWEAAQRVPGSALDKGTLRITLRHGGGSAGAMARQDALKALADLYYERDRAWWRISDTLTIAKADVLIAEWYPLPADEAPFEVGAGAYERARRDLLGERGPSPDEERPAGEAGA